MSSTHVSHVDFDSSTTSAEEHALFNMSGIQQTVLLDLRTSNVLVSVLSNIDQLVSKTCHLEGNQRILKAKRYTENTLYRRKIEMVNASRCSSSRIRCIQKAHIPFRICFGGKAEKYKKEKNKQRQYTGKTFLFRKKEFFITKACPYRTACFGQLTTLSSLAAGQLVVSQTPRERGLVKWGRCCCRPFRLLVELETKYTPPLIVSKYTPAPGLCNLNAENHPYWLGKFLPPFVFRLGMPRVLTPY